MGESWRDLGRILGNLGGSWAILGGPCGMRGFGGILGGSWRDLGRFCGVLGGSWGDPERLACRWEVLRWILGGSCGDL